MGNAGRVLMIPKGEYNSATTYEMLDFVYYQGRSYVCKQTSTGNAPTNTTYWQALTGDASAEIQALTNYVTENNVKNVLSIERIKALNYTGTWSGNTYSKNGITATVNSDGTISFNGTASEDVTLTLAEDITVDKDEIMSGCPAGGATTKYFLAFEKKTNPWTRYATDLGEGATITTRTTEDNVVYFRVRSGQTVSNLLVEPMIRDASITDPTYQPYAKTNVELTQALSASTVIDNVIDTTSAAGVSGVSASLEKLTDINMGILFISFTTTADAGGGGLILGVLKSSCTPAHSTCRAVVPLVNDSGGDVEGSLYLNSTSAVRVYKVTSGHKYYATIPIILA